MPTTNTVAKVQPQHAWAWGNTMAVAVTLGAANAASVAGATHNGRTVPATGWYTVAWGGKGKWATRPWAWHLGGSSPHAQPTVAHQYVLVAAKVPAGAAVCKACYTHAMAAVAAATKPQA